MWRNLVTYHPELWGKEIFVLHRAAGEVAGHEGSAECVRKRETMDSETGGEAGREGEREAGGDGWRDGGREGGREGEGPTRYVSPSNSNGANLDNGSGLRV